MKAGLFLLIVLFVATQSDCKPLQGTNNERTYCGVSQYHQLYKQFEQLADGRSKRIVNGVESRDSEWPWMVSLLLRGNGSAKEHMCGGTLIDRRWVVTAAHCFEPELDPSLTSKPDKWLVNVGEHNIKMDRMEDHEVENIIIHPDRDVASGNLNVDIALMKLKRPVRFSKYVNLACLPDESEEPEEAQECIVAGWGHTGARNMNAEDAAVASDVLRHALVPVYNGEDCATAYDSLNTEIVPFKIDVRSDNICAGFTEGGTDSCQYDSGGPLMCEFNGVLKLSGIVSLGSGCAQKGYPGLYTDVIKYLEWIQDVVESDRNN